jgi:hypothetical protein
VPKRLLLVVVALLSLLTACDPHDVVVSTVAPQAAPAAPEGPEQVFYTPEQIQYFQMLEWQAAEQALFDRLYAYWRPIHGCETGYTWRWDLATGNGYFGGLQFGATDWLGAGGGQFADRADHARPLDQLKAAETWKALNGIDSWPTCARRAGYL